MAKPQLILDIGGVLVTNFSPIFWQELAARALVTYELLTAGFKQDLRQSLWSGEITEEAFWSGLCGRFPSIDREQARAMLQSNLKPLPALEQIPTWSRYADIHLLSNHRIEWIAPFLLPYQDYIKSMTISSSAGYCKPSPEIFALAASHLHTHTNILFVDDQDKNIEQAALLGWKTLLADPQGGWIAKVMPLLSES
jgi:putative hydrolase of the HAD superfamily